MKKVVNASIGDRSFALDEDAYDRLTDYFIHFKAHLRSGTPDLQSSLEEMMSDLEVRIAELFDRETGGASYRVVDLNMVSRVVGRLGMPDGKPEESSDAQSDSGGRENAAYETERPRSGSGGPDFSYGEESGRERRRLFRDPEHKSVGGVCSGVAALLNVDITIVRILFLLSLLGFGAGLLVYIVLWIVVPLARTPAEMCLMRGLEPTAENMAKFSARRRTKYGK